MINSKLENEYEEEYPEAKEHKIYFLNLHSKNLFLISGFWILFTSFLLLPTFNGWIFPLAFYALTISISVLGF
jgi:hypothetical protein